MYSQSLPSPLRNLRRAAAPSTPAAAAAAAASAAPEPVKLNEIKDERILSSDKFPLENNRLGYLPMQLQKFLFTDNRNYQVSLKNASIKKDTPCLIRRGVETNDRQSFVSAIAYYYKESTGVEKTSATVMNMPPVFESVAPLALPATASLASSSAGGLELPPMTSMNVKSQILKNVTDKIQKDAMKMARIVEQDSSNRSNAPSSATVMGGVAESSDPEAYYSDEDETPVVMTPRAAASAATPRAGAAAAAAAAATPRATESTAIHPVMRRSGDYIPTIREMRTLIIQSLDIDLFITLQNGTLVDSFYNPSKELLESDLLHKYSASAMILASNPFFFNNFKAKCFLLTPDLIL